MKTNYMEFFRKVTLFLQAALGTMPITLILFAVNVPELSVVCWVLPLLYVLLSIGNLKVRGKWHIPYGLCGSALFLALGIAASIRYASFIPVLVSILYIPLLMGSLLVAGFSPKNELHPVLVWGCVVLQIVTQIAYLAMKRAEITVLLPVGISLNISFLGFMLFSMLALNRTSLSQASMGQQNASSAMRQKNSVITLSLFAMLVGVSLIPAVVNAIKSIWFKMTAKLQAFIDKFHEVDLQDMSEDYKTGMEGLDGLLPPDTPPNKLTQILMPIISVVGKIALAVVIVVVLYLLVRLSIKLLRMLSKKMNRFVNTALDDYVDEVTDLRDDQSSRSLFSRLRHRLPHVNEGTLTPNQRVRYHYLRMLFKHPEWSVGNTPRENFHSETVTLYEQARYSTHSVSTEDADLFAAEAKKA